MNRQKTIALVAHDHRKNDLMEWARWNSKILLEHKLICTGTTGKLINKTLHTEINKNNFDSVPDITLLKSGPLGGDQQLGAMIAGEKVDAIIFFWDPMSAQPHDVDVKALLRIAVVYNLPIAMNRSTADFIISSPLISEKYVPKLKDYSTYLERDI
jgi:methylglyoxal synthase